MLNLDQIISVPKSAQLLEQLLQPKKAVSAVIGLGYVGLQELAEVTKNGLLDSTTDFSRLSDADVVVICVPTPLTNQREPDLSFLRATAAVIANSLRPGQLIVLESTSWPGTTKVVLEPILESSGLRSGADFFLGFPPEREDPGSSRPAC